MEQNNNQEDSNLNNNIIEELETILKEKTNRIESLEITIKDYENKFQALELEIQNLKNLLIDRDFETGIFVEKEAFNKIDQENTKLKRLIDEFYKKELQNWYNEVRKEITK